MYNQYVLNPSCKLEFYVLGYTDLDGSVEKYPVFLVSMEGECFGIFFAKQDAVYYKLLSKEDYRDYRYYCVKNHDKVQERLPVFKVFNNEGDVSQVFMNVESAANLNILKTENARTTFGSKLKRIYKKCESYYYDGVDLYEENMPVNIGDYFVTVKDDILNINAAIKKVGVVKYNGIIYPLYLFKRSDKYSLVYYKSCITGFYTIPFERQDLLAAISDSEALGAYFNDDDKEDKIVCNSKGNSKPYICYFKDLTQVNYVPSDTHESLILRLAINTVEDLYNEKKMMDINI